MGQEIYMIDPRFPINVQMQKAINKALMEDPSLKPVPFIVDFLNRSFDFQTIARFIITSERLATRDLVEQAVARSLYRFVRTIIPGLDNPLWYNEEQAQRICDLEQSLKSTPYGTQYSVSYNNPFSKHMSLRQLRRETGVPSDNIQKDLKNGFSLGSLRLDFMIKHSSHNPIKQAIHASVHRSEGGGATLGENRIGDNITRIMNDRRMVSIIPSIISCKPKPARVAERV